MVKDQRFEHLHMALWGMRNSVRRLETIVRELHSEGRISDDMASLFMAFQTAHTGLTGLAQLAMVEQQNIEDEVEAEAAQNGN